MNTTYQGLHQIARQANWLIKSISVCKIPRLDELSVLG